MSYKTDIKKFTHKEAHINDIKTDTRVINKQFS